MATVESRADEQFVGLGRNGRRLPAWERQRLGVTNRVVLAVLLGVQIAWLALFFYTAYVFIL